MRDWNQHVREHLPLPDLKDQRDVDIVDEIASQLEECYLDAVARGLPDAEAEAEALSLISDWQELTASILASRRGKRPPAVDRELEQTEETIRARGGVWIGVANLAQDIRFGVRQLGRKPVFSIVVILTLALGIGANTTMFNLVNALLLRPLPYPDSDELVSVHHRYATHDLTTGVSAPGYNDYRQRARSLDAIAISQGTAPTLTGLGDPEQVLGGRVSDGYFETYGVLPTQGRSFLTQENLPGGANVVVISHGFWQRRLGGDANVLGRTLVLDAEPFEVVGVMPPGFVDFLSRNREFWVPLGLTPQEIDDQFRIRENSRSVARLAPGITLERARQEMSNLAETIKSELPGTYPDNWTLVVNTLAEEERAGYGSVLILLFAAAGFVLLIACANTANMLLARAVDRETEIAVRRALGAGSGHVARQLLMESVILALVGGGAGILIAVVGLPTILGLRPELTGIFPVETDFTVLMFALGIALLVGVVVGWSSVSAGLKLNIQESLREGSRRGRAAGGRAVLRRGLVVGQFALALILLAGASLMIQSVVRLSSVDPGFDPADIFIARIGLPDARYPEPQSGVAFFDELLPTLEAIPGIRGVALGNYLPFSGGVFTTIFNIEGVEAAGPDALPWGEVRTVSPSYAATMEIPVVRGRFLEESDDQDAVPVVVVDEEAVRRYWPDEDPIGKRLGWGDPSDPNSAFFTVVGVVGHVASLRLDGETRLQLYFSYRQSPTSSADLIVRSSTDPAALVRSVRSTVLGIDADQPISNVRFLEDMVESSMGDRRFLMLLLGLFSGLALFLAALGIYGVMAYEVRRRVQEMGVRLTFGATPGSLLGLVLRSSLALAAVGIVAGALGSLALGRVIQSHLYGMEAIHPPTLALAAMVLLGVAALAVYVPARRATRVDPLESLRSG